MNYEKGFASQREEVNEVLTGVCKQTEGFEGWTTERQNYLDHLVVIKQYNNGQKMSLLVFTIFVRAFILCLY